MDTRHTSLGCKCGHGERRFRAEERKGVGGEIWQSVDGSHFALYYPDGPVTIAGDGIYKGVILCRECESDAAKFREVFGG